MSKRPFSPLFLLVSTKTTLLLLFLSFCLIFWGTLDQTWYGLKHALDHCFYSFFVWTSIGSYSIPVFLGGYSLAFLLSLSLGLVFFYKRRFHVKHLGLYLLHLTLIVFLLTEGLQSLFKTEGQVMLSYGKPRNFAFSLSEHELSFINPLNPEYDEVYALDFEQFKPGKNYKIPRLNLKINVLTKWQHSALSQNAPASSTFLKVEGIDRQPYFLEPQASNDEKRLPVLEFELYSLKEGLFIGRFICSPQLPFFEEIRSKNQQLLMRLSNKRYYLPFTLNLRKFTRELHPKTNIPKSFSSLVELYSQDDQLERMSLIYMNTPLRVENMSFYQASYAQDEKTSFLQYVYNPFRLAPYVAGILMAISLFLHLLLNFIFSKRLA